MHVWGGLRKISAGQRQRAARANGGRGNHAVGQQMKERFLGKIAAQARAQKSVKLVFVGGDVLRG